MPSKDSQHISQDFNLPDKSWLPFGFGPSPDANIYDTLNTRATKKSTSGAIYRFLSSFLVTAVVFWMILPPLSCITPQTGYPSYPVRVSQDPDWMVAKFFPDAGYDLVGPAFRSNGPGNHDGWKNGTASPTSFESMVNYLETFVAAHHKYASYHEIDGKSLEGAKFPYVHIKKGNSTDKVRIWVQGEAHGNEPAGAASIYEFLGHFDQDLLDKLEFLILPRYNPDGVKHFHRQLSTGVDANRDHVLATERQTRYIKTRLNGFAPHVVIDMHEYTPRRKLAGRYTSMWDGFFAGAKNLNVHPTVRHLTESLFAERIRTDMAAKGFTYDDYMTIGYPPPGSSLPLRFNEATSAAYIGRNSHGLTQAVSFLTETRGISLADQNFRRRTATGLVMLNALVDAAYENSDLVLRTIEDAREQTIQHGRHGIGEIVVTDSRRLGTRNITLIDTVTKSAASVEVEFAYTTPTIPGITRARPYAYVIPPSLAGLKEDIEALGLVTEVLTSPLSTEVEALKIITATKSKASHGDPTLPDYIVHVTTKPEIQHVTLHKGSLVVRTDQKNAGLAFAALEPECDDSYVTSVIFPVRVGEDYPVYRVMTNVLGPTVRTAL